jgi:hypothetical protein
MTKIKTKLLGRVAVAAAVSLGLAVSAVAIAGASPDHHRSWSHPSARSAWQSNWAEGTVSSYVAGTSISILSHGSTTPTTYALSTATTVTGLGTGATLASPDRVVLELSTTTPVTVTTIKVLAPRPVWVKGTVSSFVAGTSITILSDGSATPTTYALSTSTTVTGLAAGATLASPDRVVLELSTTTPVTVTAIKVCDPSNQWVKGTVSGYVAGTSISILSDGSTTPTTYALSTSTTVTGLAAGATLASPDRVVLELSTTTPVTVTAINVLGKCAGGFGGWGHGRSHGHGFDRFGFGGRNSMQSANFRR